MKNINFNFQAWFAGRIYYVSSTLFLNRFHELNQTSDPCFGSDQSLAIGSAAFWPCDESSPAGTKLLLHAWNKWPHKLLP
jgi:hypothetical protein